MLFSTNKFGNLEKKNKRSSIGSVDLSLWYFFTLFYSAGLSEDNIVTPLCRLT